VTLTFSAPESDGGSPVTGYEYSTDGGATWHAASPTGSGPYTLEISGLANGTTYKTEVRALNMVGDGPASNMREATPEAAATVPGAPVLSSAVAGDESVTLTFSAPESDGGSPITGYEYSTDGGATWHAASPTGSGPYTLEISGLANGTTYKTEVRAVNMVGDGPASNMREATPATVPEEPTLLSAVAHDESATLEFSAPESDGGSPITGYEYSTDGGATWQAASPTGTGPYTLEISGLANGTTYTVAVRADNAVGPSELSNSEEVTPEAPEEEAPEEEEEEEIVPAAPVITSGSAVGHDANWEITLDFTTPMDSGTPITGYLISINGAPYETLEYTAGSPNSTLLEGGDDCETLSATFTVEAVNSAGHSEPSNEYEVTHGAEEC
jgi:titin